MNETQNLLYAIVQAAHNFGAVAVVGGGLGGVILKEANARKKLAWLALAGWAMQAISGASFGAVTIHFSHKFPDIGDVAWTALYIKMACAVAGFVMLSAYLYWGARWADSRRNTVWVAAAVFGVTALSAAAVLRWYS
jgi:hypothetical protein